MDVIARRRAAENEGIVVSQRSDLPALPNAAVLEVSFVKCAIGGLAGQLLRLTHTGIELRPLRAAPGVPACMTLQACATGELRSTSTV